MKVPEGTREACKRSHCCLGMGYCVVHGLPACSQSGLAPSQFSVAYMVLKKAGKVLLSPKDCSNVGEMVWGKGGCIGEADVCDLLCPPLDSWYLGWGHGRHSHTRRDQTPFDLPSAAHHHLQEHEGMHQPEGLPG